MGAPFVDTLALLAEYVQEVEDFARFVVRLPLNIIVRRSEALSDLGNVQLYCGIEPE